MKEVTYIYIRIRTEDKDSCKDRCRDRTKARISEGGYIHIYIRIRTEDKDTCKDRYRDGKKARISEGGYIYIYTVKDRGQRQLQGQIYVETGQRQGSVKEVTYIYIYG